MNVRKWKWSRSVMSDSATPWTVARQTPLFMGFSRQEYWSGLPFPSPLDLPNPGTEPRSPALQADALSSEPSGKWMWELDYKESWEPKNWFFWFVVLEKTLENPLDCWDIQLAHPKGNQSWILIGRIDAKAETSILCPLDAKNWLIWKDRDAGKDWRCGALNGKP